METRPTNTSKLVIDFEHDDHTKREHLLLHITNLLRDFGEKPIVVEVVAYGPGIMLLVAAKTEFAERINELKERGVIFHACHNAMKKFNINDSDLVAEATAVPSGVGRIVKAQLEGSVYLKG